MSPHPDALRMIYAAAAILSVVLALYVAIVRARRYHARARWALVVVGGIALLGVTAWAGIESLILGRPGSPMLVALASATTVLLAGLIGVAAGQRKNRR